MSRRHSRSRPWPPVMSFVIRRLGLLLFLLIVGHDLIMAVPGASMPGAGGHDPVAAHRPLSDAGAAPYQAPLDHPGQCAVGQEALSRPIPLSDLASAPPCHFAPDRELTLTAFRDQPLPTWQEPHLPPGVLRAFMQVFRV